jgi:hypothetical protein
MPLQEERHSSNWKIIFAEFADNDDDLLSSGSLISLTPTLSRKKL